MKGQFLNAAKPLVRSFALYALAERVSLSLDLKRARVDPRGADVGPQVSSPASDDLPRLQARYTELFQTFVQETRKAKIPVVVLFLPSAEAAARREVSSNVEELVRRLAKEAGLPFLDLTPTLAADPDAEERFFLLNRGPQGVRSKATGTFRARDIV